MYAYLHINAPKSTVKEPHKYLDVIIKENYIESLKKYFFEAHLEEGGFYSKFPVTVNKVKEEIIIDYEIEEYFDEYTAPLRAWHSKIYHFRDALYSTLKTEYLNFFGNLDEHFKKDHTLKSKQAFFKNLLGIISVRFQRIQSSFHHQDYLDLFKRFFARLCVKLKNDYSAFLPKKFDPVTESLLQTDFNAEFLDELALQSKIFDLISDLKDEKNKSIFKIENPKEARLSFKNLIYKQFDNINSPINITSFRTHISEARYIISRICFYLRVDIQFIVDENIFMLNGKPLTANSTYTAKNRMQHDKTAAKYFIDDLFSSAIS